MNYESSSIKTFMDLRAWKNQLIIAKDVHYLEEKAYTAIADQAVVVHKILNGLIKGSKTVIRNS